MDMISLGLGWRLVVARVHGHNCPYDSRVCLQSSLGFTPLHFACDARDVEVCDLVSSCMLGAISLTLTQAHTHHLRQSVRRILLSDSYLDIDKPSHDGLTPLDVSRKSGEEDGWLEPNPEITAVRCLI